MTRRTIIDTDIAIDFLRGETNALAHLKAEAEFVCFSAVTVAEIYAGIRGKKEEAEVERFFSIFPVIAVTNDIARHAGRLVNRYRASHSVELPDALIAATCMISDSDLHTLNVRHYPMFAGLKAPYRKR